MKNWLQNHMIAVWAICSILFAIIIHLLFHWETDIEILHAKWEAGDILTYVSTVALGLLAMWQNKRFKEENDVSQERFERLTEQANEISSINKIIEIESARLIRLKTALDDFSEACDPETISKIFLFDANSASDMKSNTIPADLRIQNSFTSLRRELPHSFGVDGSAKDSFSEYTIAYKNAVTEYLSQVVKGNIPPDSEYFGRIYDARDKFTPVRDNLIREREELLNKTVYGNMSLDEIKVMYNHALYAE